MKKFLEELGKGHEEWRAMKLVIMGHGRIGKTTLLHVIKSQLNHYPYEQVSPNMNFMFKSN